MKFIPALFLSIVVVLVVCFFPPSAFSMSGWEISLRAQLKQEHFCDVNFLSRIQEFKLGEKDVVSGRAHCKDEREYDFIWDEGKQKFDIKVCEVKVC